MNHKGVGLQRDGRAPGAIGVTTRSAKSAVLAVFDAIGGDEAFAAWAEANPDEFYAIYAKLLPADMRHTVVTGDLKSKSREELEAIRDGRTAG